MSTSITPDDIERLERHLRDMKRMNLLGDALSEKDFKAWLQNAAAWLLDKFEDAWKWVRNALGLT